MVEELTVDEKQVLDEFRRSKAMRHSELMWCIRDGKLVKLQVLEKIEIKEFPLREGFQGRKE